MWKMKWISHSAEGADLTRILRDGADAVREGLDGEDPDLVLLFTSPAFQEAHEHIPAAVYEMFSPGCLLGCTASGVIGGGQEQEDRPAVAVLAAKLPGVTVRPFFTDTQDLPDDDAPPEVWRTWIGLPDEHPTHFLLAADPFSTLIDPFLAGLDFAYPRGVKVGGLASGGRRPGDHAVFIDRQCFNSGLAGVALSGDITMDSMVAQGCRPIGDPLTVTGCRGHTILEVNRESPLVYLNRLFGDASEQERELMKSALFIGMRVDDPEHPDRAPFLIRNLIGADYEKGTLDAGSMIHEGMVIQFHLRDRASAMEDLDRLLQEYDPAVLDPDRAGALMFSCVGRGRRLFGMSNYDSSCLVSRIGDLPVGGFFCNGEIGPVGGASFVHGYSTSFALVRPGPV